MPIPPALLTLALLLPGPQDPPEGERFGRSLVVLDDVDVDGDGAPDLAVGAPAAGEPVRREGRGRVLVLSGATREVLQVWRGEATRELFGDSLRPAGDADADGVGDVLVGYEFGDRTEVRSGADGALLVAFDRAAHEVVAFGDLDRDGAADFLLVGERLEVRSGRDGAYLGGHIHTGGKAAFHAVGDLDGDGLVDGVLVTDMARLVRTTRKEGAGEAWRPYDHVRREWLGGLWPRAFEGRRVTVLDAGPAGDLDGDGSPDLLLRVRVDGRSELWGLSLAHPAPRFVAAGEADLAKEYGVGYAALPAGDLDADECGDVVIAEPLDILQVGIRVVSGATGRTLWKQHWGDGGATAGVSFARLEDADGDGVGEILVGSSDWIWHGSVVPNGHLRCYSGGTGELLWRVQAPR